MENSEIKRYYVGADSIAHCLEDGINAKCCHMNLSEAIKEAEKKIKNGASSAIIVQIIRIVRRAAPPIEVIDIE